jgi:signal transduction histidine kinase
VKRRTIELEEKNRELEIEASLEKVRAQALGMRTSEDLLHICRTLYKELAALGFDTLRNAVIHVFHDERACFTDHEYSDSTGGNITTVPFKGDATIEKFIKRIRKSENAFVELKVEGKELSNWKLFRKKTGQIKDNRLKQIKAIHYYIYSVGHASIGISSFDAIEKDKKELLKRFRNVFDFAYRRYTDIALAQAQAREAQIELGLERVRARAMAMQNSVELAELVQSVFNELTALDVALTRCMIAILDEPSFSARWWMANSEADKKPTSSYIRYNALPYFKELFQQWKSRSKSWTYELKGKDKVLLDDYLMTETELKHLPKKVKDGMRAPHRVMLYASFNNFGYLHVSSLEPLSEESLDILARFGKVFDLTYTRFNDLKQAEAQAREAQIQLALERVRARTMAMHTSEELAETVHLLFQQFKELGENPDQATIGIINEKDRVIEYWVTMHGNQINKVFRFTIDEPNVTKRIFKAWKEEKKSLVIDLSGKALADFMKYRASMGGAAVKPNEKRRVINVAFFSKGILNVQYMESRSEESLLLLERFAKVFEQTYTRVLDLQKAEAQAREAKIEAALERVRGKAMAMHGSNDLAVTVDSFFTELNMLRVNPHRCGVTLIEAETCQANLTFTTATSDGNFKKVTGVLKLTGHPVLSGVYDHWKLQKEYHPVLYGAEIKEYYKAMNPQITVPDFADDLTQFGYYFFFKEGGVYAWTDKELVEEDLQIFRRFTSVLSLTYRRYMDLKEAEAQAREAQIEAALERVRAQSMAMHHPDDLDKVNKELLNQLHQLQITGLTGVTFYLTNENGWVNAWDFSSPGNIGAPNSYMLQFDFTKYEMLGEPFRALLQSDQDYFIADYPLEKLKKAVYELEEINPATASVFREALASGKLTHQWSACAKIANGILGVDLVNPPNEDTKTIVLKMAGAFNQAYTRFLDLQKAEALAREAQIEAALERVRAQTMAMHSSEDVGKCVVKMFSELTALGVDEGTRFGIGILNHDNENNQLWTARKDGEEVNMHIGNIDMASHPLLKSARKAWKEQVTFHKYVLEGQDLLDYYQMLNKAPDYKIQIPIEKLPKKEIQHCFIFEHGFFYAFTPREFQPELIHITQRFSSLFEQTYRRYLDLVRAEAQAREAQIEAALEKVRSRSLAMHRSDELKEVVSVLFERLKELQIPFTAIGIATRIEDSKDLNSYVCGENEAGLVLTNYRLPYFENQILKDCYNALEKQLDFFVGHYSKEEKDAFYNYVIENTAEFRHLPEDIKRMIFDSTNYTISTVAVKNAVFNVNDFEGKVLAEEEVEIIQRFARVFDQAYTRFLDLQKAEAQAREAQVETSLERVRSKTMAMHNSQEVGESVATLFDELLALGVLSVNDRCGIGIMQPDEKMEAWTAAKTADGKAELTIGYLNMTAHPLLEAAYHGWAEKLEKYQYILEGEDILRYYDAIRNQADYKIKRDYFSDHPKIVHTDFYFNEGCLYVFSLNEFSSDSAKIFLRFAAVFGQTYRRYLDLQKAETQAREAQIEAAMEKVRSRAMAMQKPTELVEVAKLLRKEMGMLGVEELETSSIYIHNHESGITECWYAIKDEKNQENKLVSDHMSIDLNVTWVGRQMADFYHSNEKQTSIVMTGENRQQWINYCANHSKVLVGYYGENIPDRTYHLHKFSGGYMGAAATGSISNESWDLLQRACSVFSLAYTRFKDLQQAEARAREAVKQAALDRVRADIASMRNTSDLDRIIPLIWKELTTLGIPFIRCGVFIMDEKQSRVHTYLSTPDGRAIAAYHTPMNDSGNLDGAIQSWRQQAPYVVNWGETDFIKQADVLLYNGAIHSRKEYLKDIPTQGFYLHFLPFEQGMLYAGNTTQLDGEQLELIQSVADAFSTAYARYEDFTRLEEAKKQVEKTLNDLKQAQQQLVQSEKMASLGELTAGIAHEIQNPLNFVNNFSEVSNELLDEMNEEIEKGNIEDAKAIALDVKQNLEKILHHGKRADGIVKGMLQHSRSSSGTKEPTDINALADEYLRLAYHGLRAKDKSFNAKFETHFDESIEKIQVVPQDIGRVILNLITNAFYVVAEKKKKYPESFEPTVIVSSRKVEGKVELRVKDNGLGIPDSIKEKIFQPFFTTKPTGQGTGLGLSLSYDIVKAHGGELKVETKVGEGSTFTIILPS